MDKKTRRKIEALTVRIQKLERQLAGAKQQCSATADVGQLEQQISGDKAKLMRLLES